MVTAKDWRENAKHGCVGISTGDMTSEWDAWLAEHDAQVLRDAAVEVWKSRVTVVGPDERYTGFVQSAQMLRALADQIEKGEDHAE